MSRTTLLVTGMLAVTLVAGGCNGDSVLATDDAAATLGGSDDRSVLRSDSSSQNEQAGVDDRRGSGAGEAGDDRGGSGHGSDDVGADDRGGAGQGADDVGGDSGGRGTGATAGGNDVATGLLRLRCELRTGERSKVSVDGNDLRPLNGLFGARIRSGANGASAGAVRAVGDEVEFDFDSDPGDIAAGAVAIPRNFIQVQAGRDVTAEILDASGRVVASAAADCAVR